MQDPQTESLDELAENFALFDDWEDKYRYIIELGGRLPPFDDGYRVDENLVRGCTSRVWMVADFNDGRLHIQADSDAQIVRGLIFLLLAAYQDQSAADIQAYDVGVVFTKMGLDQHLSPNRRNGFFAMVEKIKALAQAGAVS